ncbi:MAG: hypothetical protein HYS25_01080 [Ignavibacteriales bacterium]|nr:hypothetical protein [Ignavibacteriales bacterium]
MKHKYNLLSSRKCKHPGCHKYLKQNLIDRNPEAHFCFKHYPHSKKNRPGANENVETLHATSLKEETHNATH